YIPRPNRNHYNRPAEFFTALDIFQGPGQNLVHITLLVKESIPVGDALDVGSLLHCHYIAVGLRSVTVIIRKLTKTTQNKSELMCHSNANLYRYRIRPVKSVSASVRSAIMTMVAIVASYLISNTLHLILTVMERSDHPILHDTEDPLLSSTFHTFFSDAVSFVYMFTSAIRLLIYFFCNPAIRGDILTFFGSSSPVLL
ncbi:hypothetical protein OSTOST_21691, partial [Ostertagia ostertagi]